MRTTNRRRRLLLARTLLLSLRSITVASFALRPNSLASPIRCVKMPWLPHQYQNGQSMEQENVGSLDSNRTELSWSKRLGAILAIRKKTNGAEQNNPKKRSKILVENLDELRHAVLSDKVALRNIDYVPNSAAANLTHNNLNTTTSTLGQLGNHPVLRILRQRVQTNSTPGNRETSDTAHIALAIEGGGMRGAVSAGMAAAIASLGLTDAFDSVYGSSAGSIVGAYMISRQMCVDVYTQVLPAAKRRFASKSRVVGNLGVELVNDLVQRIRPKQQEQHEGDIVGSVEATSQEEVKRTSRWSRIIPTGISDSLPALLPSWKLSPGMNISFVLDGIMSEQYGLRPFDMESFRRNDAKQPLFAVASTVRDGKLETVAFSSQEGDYFDGVLENCTAVPENNTIVVPVGRIRRALRALKGGVTRFVQIPVRAYRGSSFLIRRFSFRKRSRNTKDSSTKEEVEPDKPKRKHITAVMSPLFRRLPKEENAVMNVVQVTSNGTIIQEASACPYESGKKGFFACIESSMLVPGAAGAPVKLLRSKHRQEAEASGVNRMANICFDAFCYEPIPYRSAVENGATHVLALRSRPAGCFVETQPAVYEKLVAPIFFRRHRLPQLVYFFESGGSQYRYLEDILTLDEGLYVGSVDGEASCGVKVPPTTILFGTEQDDSIFVDTDTWKRAHLLPIVLPTGTPELPTLTQDKDDVLLAVRNGFAAAFDVLAPIARLDFDPVTVDSKKIAELLFPQTDDENDLNILETPVEVKGDYIQSFNIEVEKKKRRRFANWMSRKRKTRQKERWITRWDLLRASAVEVEREVPDSKQFSKADSLDWLEAETLLAMLPGFQGGRLSHLSGGLRSVDVREEA